LKNPLRIKQNSFELNIKIESAKLKWCSAVVYLPEQAGGVRLQVDRSEPDIESSRIPTLQTTNICTSQLIC
jgi:hypothetical protein